MSPRYGTVGQRLQSLGNNLESRNTCSFTAAGDLVDTDPLLGPPADDLGSTFTHAFLAGDVPSFVPAGLL